MYSLPFGVCSQKTRPITASSGTLPDASWVAEYVVRYWSVWFQVLSAAGLGASAPQTCTFSTDPNDFLVRLPTISWYFVYRAARLSTARAPRPAGRRLRTSRPRRPLAPSAPLERRPAGKALVKHAAERVLVGRAGHGKFL